VVVTDEADVRRRSGIEIELSGARVRVPPGTDPRLLADVLRTLKALGWRRSSRVGRPKNQ
jgi:hypothetical protein